MSIKKVAYKGVVCKILETGTLSIFLGRSTGYPEPFLTRLGLVVNVSLARVGRFYNQQTGSIPISRTSINHLISLRTLSKPAKSHRA